MCIRCYAHAQFTCLQYTRTRSCQTGDHTTGVIIFGGLCTEQETQPSMDCMDTWYLELRRVGANDPRTPLHAYEWQLVSRGEDAMRHTLPRHNCVACLAPLQRSGSRARRSGRKRHPCDKREFTLYVTGGFRRPSMGSTMLSQGALCKCLCAKA
jgi:hypothetical protein